MGLSLLIIWSMNTKYSTIISVQNSVECGTIFLNVTFITWLCGNICPQKLTICIKKDANQGNMEWSCKCYTTSSVRRKKFVVYPHTLLVVMWRWHGIFSVITSNMPQITSWSGSTGILFILLSILELVWLQTLVLWLVNIEFYLGREGWKIGSRESIWLHF